MPWVGFKTLPSGYAATNPWSVADKQDKGDISAKAVAGALYTWWQVRSMPVGNSKALTQPCIFGLSAALASQSVLTCQSVGRLGGCC
jgi:hypothetical protein